MTFRRFAPRTCRCCSRSRCGCARRQRGRQPAPARCRRTRRADVRDRGRDVVPLGFAREPEQLRSRRAVHHRAACAGARSTTTAGCAATTRSTSSPWRSRSSADRKTSTTASPPGLRYNFVQPGSRLCALHLGRRRARLDRQPRGRLRRAGPGFHLQHPDRGRHFVSR